MLTIIVAEFFMLEKTRRVTISFKISVILIFFKYASCYVLNYRVTQKMETFEMRSGSPCTVGSAAEQGPRATDLAIQ
jgi:hypothetical protein